MSDYGPYNTPLGIYSPSYNATGGNPDGYISTGDPTGNTFYWQAPNKFLGNQSGSYEQSLSWDQKHNGGISWDNNADLILVGGGYTLVKTTDFTPNSTWQTFSVNLNETGWHIGTPSGSVVTGAQFKSALSSLTGLYIRGEFTYGQDEIDSLDNVRLTAVPEPSTCIAAVLLGIPLALQGVRNLRTGKKTKGRMVLHTALN